MKKQLVKDSGIEGVKVGIIAFLITFIVSLVLSALVNVTWIEDINRLINGSLSVKPEVTGTSVLTLTSMFVNMSLFNSGQTLASGGTLHIGVLSFALLPVISFIIADRRDNKQKSFDLHDMIIYSVSSIIFAACVYLFSVITKGTFIGLVFDFTSIRNFFMTMVITMCIQLLIGINYNKTFSPGIRLTRRLLRSFIGIGLVIGLIGMIVVLTKLLGGTIPFIVIVLMALIMLPNVAIYIMFTFMGASIQFGEKIHTLLYDYLGIDLGFAALPLPIKIGMIALLFGIVLYSVYRLEKKGFIREVLLFALSFSFLSLILCYCTKMNLGVVAGLIGIELGYYHLYVFLVPLIIILLAGCLVISFRKLTNEIKQ